MQLKCVRLYVWVLASTCGNGGKKRASGRLTGTVSAKRVPALNGCGGSAKSTDGSHPSSSNGNAP